MLRGPLERFALRGVLVATAVTAIAAAAGGAVRLLPWLIDPSISLRVVTPFARGVVALAMEAALLVGWPVGWSLAAVQLVERGEARVLATLGESPSRTVLRLLPQGAIFACALALVSFAGGREASEPGRVVTELLAQGRKACAGAPSPVSLTVPFAGATWLCRPDAPPRLFGHAPGSLSGALFTAEDATLSGDLRRIALTDARLLLGSTPSNSVNIHVAALTLRGLSPWAHASSIPAALRAVVLAAAAWGAGSLAVYVVLCRLARRRFAALAVGAAGPLASLGTLRVLEQKDAYPPLALLVVLLAPFVTLLLALALSRLPRLTWTASK